MTERERGTDWEMGLGVGRQNLSAMRKLETATTWAGREMRVDERIELESDEERDHSEIE